MDMNELATSFGTHTHCIERWINTLNISQDEIAFTIENFVKSQRRSIMVKKLRPAQYLVDHSELIEHVQQIPLEVIKAIPEDVYLAHLSALEIADRNDDKINNRTFPYNSYDAEVFKAYRHLTKQADIKFVRRMFGRSISHHSYRAAKQKLSLLVKGFA